jgi:hypothetical protein
MNIMINEIKTSATGTVHMDIACNKASAYISIDKDGRVNVCTKNASHRAWGGMGRFFRTKAEALAGYKSGELRAMIEAAFDAIAPTNLTAH